MHQRWISIGRDVRSALSSDSLSAILGGCAGPPRPHSPSNTAVSSVTPDKPVLPRHGPTLGVLIQIPSVPHPGRPQAVPEAQRSPAGSACTAGSTQLQCKAPGATYGSKKGAVMVLVDTLSRLLILQSQKAHSTGPCNIIIAESWWEVQSHVQIDLAIWSILELLFQMSAYSKAVIVTVPFWHSSRDYQRVFFNISIN